MKDDEGDILHQAFENWWSNTAIPQAATVGKSIKQVIEIKEVAFAAWDHQRTKCATVIKDIIQTIKDSTL